MTLPMHRKVVREGIVSKLAPQKTAGWVASLRGLDEMTPDRTPEPPRAPQNRPAYMEPETLAELQRLSRLRARSGRQSAAKASAIRTLERLERSRRRGELPPCPPDWHPWPGTAWEELDRAYLEANPDVRERMWRIHHGLKP